ncbi:hypothetical protein [Streptomyces sp. NPDC004065]|uniref:hypothetical protein n=1 Tax=Streptomyces sp. NPDC004065 TaxID=3364689 RepID=UPI00384D7B34
MLATRVSKIVASVVLAAGGMTLSAAVWNDVERIPGAVEAEPANRIGITAGDSTDDVTWGK